MREGAVFGFGSRGGAGGDAKVASGASVGPGAAGARPAGTGDAGAGAGMGAGAGPAAGVATPAVAQAASRTRPAAGAAAGPPVQGKTADTMPGDVFAARGPSPLCALDGAVSVLDGEAENAPAGNADSHGVAEAPSAGAASAQSSVEVAAGMATEATRTEDAECTRIEGLASTGLGACGGDDTKAAPAGTAVNGGGEGEASVNGPRVALHYGNPGTEERALARGAAFTDLSDREIVRLAGADRLPLLESLTTQHMADLAPGETRELLLLTPQGHVENQALAVDDGEATWLLCDAGYGHVFAEFLTRMRFMMRVEIEERPNLGALGVYVKPGAQVPEAFAALAEHDGEGAAGNGGAGTSGSPSARAGAGARESASTRVANLPRWRDPWPDLAPHGALYGPQPQRHPGHFRTLVIQAVERGELAAAARRLVEAGLRPAGSLAGEAIRVAAWRPRMGAEGAVAKALPHELDWLRTAVNLGKGCYRGQETVAKTVNLGRPPRRLAMLYLEGEYGELPVAGADVVWNGRVAGTVTSTVRSVDDGPVALAILRRAVPGDAVLDVGEYRAGQRVIVNLEGKSSVSPQTRPGAELRGRGLGGPAGAPGGRGLAGGGQLG